LRYTGIEIVASSIPRPLEKGTSAQAARSVPEGLSVC